MKIGFDAKRLFNNFTGLGNYSRTLVSNMQRYYPDNQYNLYTPKVKYNEETTPFLDKNFKVNKAHGLIPSLWRSCSIVQDLKRDKIDIYHGLSHDLPFGIQYTKIRSVVTIHDVCYKTFPDMFPFTERSIYELKYRHSCLNSSRIIAISESTKRDIIELLGVDAHKIDVIYQAINPTFYSRQSDIEVSKVIDKYNIPKEYILSVGSINSRKNLLGIVHAYTLLPKELQIPLVIVGNGGEYKEQVLRFATNAGIENKLIMLGNLTSSVDLQAIYQQAELLIYPSFYEGFGLPVTEALLCGTPVITSNVSSLPEAAGPGALYVDPTNIAQIAQSIEKLLIDTKLRAELIQEGHNYALTKFDPRHLTAQVENLYHQLL